MKKITFLLIIPILIFSNSCTNDYNDDIIHIAGVYDASLVGSFIAFDMGVTIGSSDRLSIEAPFDGLYWSLIDVKLKDIQSDVVKFEIKEQFIDFSTSIYGEGFYTNGTIQLDYYIEDEFSSQYYQIIASKY